MAKILFTCFGSYGDLFPYLALAKELQQRGHDVAIGTTSIFQLQIEAEGIRFVHLRNNLDVYSTAPEIRAFIRRIFDPLKGGELITREMMARIEDTYQDTLNAIEKVDLVISNPLAYATPIACRQRQITWLSTVLAPMFFLSAYDPPIISVAPWVQKINHFSPPLYRGLFKLIKAATLSWTKPVYQLCERHHLPKPSGNPLFEGQYSPHGTLAMFSECFADPQPDWPVHTHITGFPLYSREISENNKRQALKHFIEAGNAPLVFALGSSAVNMADDFYVVSAAITRQLKKRAVLVYGGHDDHISNIPPGDDLFIIDYVSYDQLFPHASVIVHQGGIGTLAQSLCAQRPMLVVPFGFDQFDNGERIAKLGLGKYLSRKKYTVKNALPIIEELLNQTSYQQEANKVGQFVQRENGIIKAANRVETYLMM